MCVSWIDDTLRGLRRRHVGAALERTTRSTFARGWVELSEVERHAVMQHLVEVGAFGDGVELAELCFRCELCGAHTVRYVEWAPLQCLACKNTYTWTALDPTHVVVE